MSSDVNADDQWYYDTASHSVSQGKQRSFSTRMGPYPTREAAENAIETAKARNEAADAQDRD